MTQTIAEPVSTVASTALKWRRWALVSSPVVAGLLITAASAVDPAVGADGRELYEKYAAETNLQQLHTNLLHWGFGFFGISALFVNGLVRGRGAWLANLAVAFGFAGLITLPGMVSVDFITSGVTQANGAEAMLRADGQIDAMWGIAVFAIPGAIGLIAGPVFGALALMRAGLVRWWAPAAVLVSFLALNFGGFTWWSGALMTVLLATYSLALWNATRTGDHF
ncbi:MAG: hypothetical protein WB508_04610 [Aeromicrobium sp.]|uniref:hypothetical protein n=1 Tax=Aeromicrobium sp. TaxID=1871063 RepID=UPI003C3628E3